MRSDSGQATVEYVVVAVGVVIALVIVGIVGQQHCVDHFDGRKTAAQCDGIGRSTALALQQSIEEVTFLINLPF